MTYPAGVQPPTLYGRDAELARLAESLAEGRALAVVGEAGVGKTSLVRAAVARAGLEVREGGALETLAWMPFLALRRAVGDDLRGDATAVAIEVEQRLGPQLLFIDDLQWTDGATREVLGLLAGRIALVTTIRSSNPGGSDVQDIAAALQAGVIELGGVDREAAVAIARRARPALGETALDLVITGGGGNPLLLEELATRGHPTSSLSRALTARLDRLSQEGREAFALLAVAGHAMPVTTLGPGASELLLAGVAIGDESALAPRHALLADAMLASLSTAALRDCHDRLASLIDNAGERAHHLAGAGHLAEALAAAQEAADQAVTATDRAALLDLVGSISVGPDAILARIVASRLLVARGGGGPARAIELLEPMVEGPPELLLERESLLATAYWDTGDLDASRAAYQRGQDLQTGLPSPASASLTASQVAFVLNVDGDLEEARRILAKAIASGNDTPRVAAIDQAIRAFVDGVDTFAPILAAYERLISDPNESGAAFGTARNVAYVAAICRGYEENHDFLLRTVKDFESLEMAGRADDLRSEDVQVLLFAGRLTEGLALADTLLERPLSTRARYRTLTKRAQLLAAQGRSDAAGAILAEIASSVTSDYAGRGELLEARIDVASWSARPDDVLKAYEAHLGVPSPSRANDIMPLLDAQWARLEAGLELGAAVPQQSWAMLTGASFESAGILALHRGDPGVAARSFAAAWEAWAPFHVGRELICRWAQGEALRRAQSTDAEGVLREALDRSEARGYRPMAARVRRSLRQAGIRVTPPRRETDMDRLSQMTGREREALQLVGRGLTTPEIARRMGLGRGTVDQILGAATRKLGAASRIQAAAILAQAASGSQRRLLKVTVQNEADAGGAILAALGGVSIRVDAGTDPILVERIQGDLRRLGRDDAITLEPVTATLDLAADGEGLLGLLVEGLSLGEAAGSMHLSRRTADRRLRAARVALGVATTAEALLAFQRRAKPG